MKTIVFYKKSLHISANKAIIRRNCYKNVQKKTAPKLKRASLLHKIVMLIKEALLQSVICFSNFQQAIRNVQWMPASSDSVLSSVRCFRPVYKSCYFILAAGLRSSGWEMRMVGRKDGEFLCYSGGRERYMGRIWDLPLYDLGNWREG
jgi:hypothetical protein